MTGSSNENTARHQVPRCRSNESILDFVPVSLSPPRPPSSVSRTEPSFDGRRSSAPHFLPFRRVGRSSRARPAPWPPTRRARVISRVLVPRRLSLLLEIRNYLSVWRRCCRRKESRAGGGLFRFEIHFQPGAGTVLAGPRGKTVSSDSDGKDGRLRYDRGKRIACTRSGSL